ncbi:hypothetical protein [Thioalkalivibrio sp. ALMg3]|uniref:hypothetical protein n=1 Tax=Thioalkalivibrio sp. ALMg3 TaxID=1158163 RepID=UPI0012DE670B|nr:hypothetical protein [Thioalkalivibrio sp. ALMg3]
MDELEHPVNWHDLLDWFNQRYDSDKLVNRFSDALQKILFVIEALVLLAQVTVIGLALWLAVYEDPANAALAWLAVLIAVVHVLFVWLVNFGSKVITNRFVGEAAKGRKAAADLEGLVFQQSTRR